MGVFTKKLNRYLFFILACWIAWAPAKAHAAKLYMVIFQIGGQAETLAALKAGSIHGGVIASPATAEAKRLGMMELVNMATLGVPYPHTTITTTDRFLKGNRDVAMRFTRAYWRGFSGF